MKPRKLPLILGIALGIVTMLVAYFVFDIHRYAGKLGFAVVLIVLVLFARPWHKGTADDDDIN